MARTSGAGHGQWGALDKDVLHYVFEKLLPFPGQLAQCRLVCSSWKHAIETFPVGQARLIMAGDLMQQVANEKADAYHNAIKTAQEESHSSGLMHSHVAHTSQLKRYSTVSGVSDGSKPCLQFPLTWPLHPSKISHQPGCDSRAGTSSFKSDGAPRRSSRPEARANHDCVLWYGSLMTLTPAASDASLEPQHPAAEYQGDMQAARPGLSNRGGSNGSRLADKQGMDCLFEACLCQSTAEDLLADIDMLDVSKLAAVEATALLAVKAAISLALADASKAAKAPPAKLRRTPRRGAQFARGCDGPSDAAQATATTSAAAEAAESGAQQARTQRSARRVCATAAPAAAGNPPSELPAQEPRHGDAINRASSGTDGTATGSRKRGRSGQGCSTGKGSQCEGEAAPLPSARAVVEAPCTMVFPGTLMWNPEEYYTQEGPVFRAAPGDSAAIGGRAGTAVPAGLVGALLDTGYTRCPEALVRLSCSLEVLHHAAYGIMHAPLMRTAIARQRRASGGRPERAWQRVGPRTTLPGGAARALIFQVLSTQHMMQQLKHRIGNALGSARTIDMSASRSLDPTVVASMPDLPSVRSLTLGQVRLADHMPPDPDFHASPRSPPATLATTAILSRLLSRFPNLEHVELALEYQHTTKCVTLELPNPPPPLRSLDFTALPDSFFPSHVPPLLPAAPALTTVTALRLTHGLPHTELDSHFGAARAACIAALPSLEHLSLTFVNHALEDAAAGALAAATGLTALEILRCVPAVPMNFFDFHGGIRFVEGMRRLRRLKINDARFICRGANNSWDPLGELTTLDTLVLSGAHLNWADYSPLSRLTALTDLQLAHCSGALPMQWLAAAAGLRRLYVKGNGAAWGQTVALAGGATALSLLDGLQELYLGLCEFTEADGHTRMWPPPCISHLSTLTNLRTLTIVDCPFSIQPSAHSSPLAATLRALPGLTKLRIGHSGRVHALRGLNLLDADADELRGVHAVYAAVGQLGLQDLTLDCHPAFDSKDLQTVISGNTSLRELRLFGSSACTQRSMMPLAALRYMTRLVIGAKFFAAAPAGRASAVRACTSRQAAAAADAAASLDTTFKRMLAGLMPQVQGSLHVLVLLGPLGKTLQQEVAHAHRFRGLLVGLNRWSHMTATRPGARAVEAYRGMPEPPPPVDGVVHPVLPQPFGRQPVNPTQWDTWPYDCPSDDDEYAANVPAWLDVTAQPDATLSDDEMAGLSDEEGSVGAGGGWGGAEAVADDGAGPDEENAEEEEDEDDEQYHFGHFFDPFTGRMYVNGDSESDVNAEDEEAPAAWADEGGADHGEEEHADEEAGEDVDADAEVEDEDAAEEGDEAVAAV
eukprot:jgi/Ulvmu1/11800/UM080_0011.1